MEDASEIWLFPPNGRLPVTIRHEIKGSGLMNQGDTECA